MKVVWTARAQQRLQEIHEYISTDQPLNAERFVGRLLARGEQVGKQPRSGRMVPEYQRNTIREVIEGQYRIIYRIRSGRVDVLSVRYAAQRLPPQRKL